MKLILASNSPRRKFILNREGYEFSIYKSNFDEVTIKNCPEQTALENAKGKAKDIFNRLNDSENVVLGADTIVVFDNKIIGKPKNKLDAIKTLKMLSNNTHKVVTGYAIITKNKEYCGYDESFVTFPTLSDELINEYVESEKPLDKAGSYGLQDGYIKVKEFKGSYDNIIGLPTEKIKPILDKLLNK